MGRWVGDWHSRNRCHCDSMAADAIVAAAAPMSAPPLPPESRPTTGSPMSLPTLLINATAAAKDASATAAPDADRSIDGRGVDAAGEGVRFDAVEDSSLAMSRAAR